MKVGIFDSGIGGLSVLYDALRMLPDVDFVYYADEKHVPYGSKSDEELRTYVREIIAFLLDRDVDAIVIACNTATTVATRTFRATVPVPVIGMEPAVKKAIETFGDSPGRILVAATPVTVAGDKLHSLLGVVDKTHEVDLIALPELVRFAEEREFDSPAVDEYLEEAFSSYDLDRYDALVLGCTHFNYFKDKLLAHFDGNVAFVDGNEGTVRQLMRKLGLSDTISLFRSASKTRTVEYFSSGRAAAPIELRQVDSYLRRLEEMADI